MASKSKPCMKRLTPKRTSIPFRTKSVCSNIGQNVYVTWTTAAYRTSIGTCPCKIIEDLSVYHCQVETSPDFKCMASRGCDNQGLQISNLSQQLVVDTATNSFFVHRARNLILFRAILLFNISKRLPLKLKDKRPDAQRRLGYFVTP